MFDYTDKILTVFLTVFSGTNIFAHAKVKKNNYLVKNLDSFPNMKDLVYYQV